MTDPTALDLARAYHAAWSTGDFAAATQLLADDLVVEVPINEYPTPESFAAAVAAFAGMTTSVRLLSALGAGDEAMLLYDMDVVGLGTLRVVEHFTVAQGVIVRLRQIHDTHALRATGAAAA